MNFPHPILAVAWKQAAQIRRQHRELQTAEKSLRILAAANDELRADLAVQKRRTARWRGAAETQAARYPADVKMQTAYLFQAMSDDISDLPEIDHRGRNTAPRSAP